MTSQEQPFNEVSDPVSGEDVQDTDVVATAGATAVEAVNQQGSTAAFGGVQGMRSTDTKGGKYRSKVVDPNPVNAGGYL